MFRMAFNEKIKKPNIFLDTVSIRVKGKDLGTIKEAGFKSNDWGTTTAISNENKEFLKKIGADNPINIEFLKDGNVIDTFEVPNKLSEDEKISLE